MQPRVFTAVITTEHLGDEHMKYITLLAIVACGLTAACTVRSERTVVQPTPTAAAPSVVYADTLPPSSTTTVYVPAR
jgi:hypothetical protein